MRPKKYKTKKERLLAKKYYNMKQRCTNPRASGYEYYGGKGIGVCPSWSRNPLTFVEWGIRSGFSPGLSIDRKDSDKDYSPENCQWLTVLENNAKQKRKPRASHPLQFQKRGTPKLYALSNIPRDFWSRVKHRAVDEGITLRELILRAIEKYLKK